MQQGLSSTGNDSFFDSGASGVQCIDNAVLLLSNLDLGSTSDANDGDATRELRQSFLEFFSLVIGFCCFDGMLDEIASFFESLGITGSSQNNGVVLINLDLFASSELLGRDFFQFHAHFLGNDGSTGQESQILHGSLAVVSESWCLDRAYLDSSSELVDHQGGQSLAFDVLGNDQQRALALDDGFQNWDKLLQTADLLFHQQDVRIFQYRGLGLGIGDEVGADVSAFEFHSFDDFQFVVQSLTVLNGDDTFLTNSFHGIRDKGSNFSVRVGRDSSDLCNFFLACDGSADLCEGFDDGIDCQIDSPSQVLRV
mmetsp:Transcript_16921/g.39082  ORF Transcript_16921/g.39082 Transcript_16921/m.39082 type:complete len:311 (+) Transcript_16921:528-1460(+)